MGHVTLWLGSDHLLQVRLYGFTETYERFYFRDIQAVIVRLTHAWISWNFAFGILTLLAAALASTAASAAGRIAWGSIAAAFLASFLAGLLRGPSCVAHLRTPLRQVELKSLRRARLARRVLARLRPLVEAAQGALDAESARARLHAGPPPVPAAPAAAAPAAPGARPVRRDNGRAHEVLWLLLVADTALTAFQMSPGSDLLDAGALLLLAAQFGFAVAAVARQKDSDLDPGLRRFAWSVLGYLCAVTVAGFGLALVQSMRAVLAGGAPPADLRFLELQAVSLVCTGSLSVWGIVLIRRHRAARRPTWSDPAT
jgi:hypothetical protein